MFVSCVEIPAEGMQTHSEHQGAGCDEESCEELAYRRGTERRRKVVFVNHDDVRERLIKELQSFEKMLRANRQCVNCKKAETDQGKWYL